MFRIDALAVLVTQIIGVSLFALYVQAHDDPSMVSGKIWTHEKKGLHCPDRDLIFPCAEEMKGYLEVEGGRENPSKEEAAYECAKKAYDVSEDFWVLKNMTHLLLDLDTSDHNFDRDTKDNKFIRLGLDFGYKLMYHEDCMAEFEKNELECRCAPLYAKIMLLKLKNAGRMDDAQALFEEVKGLSWSGTKNKFKAGEAIRWETIHQTPQIWVPNLKSEPVWPESRRKDLPIWDILEDNYPMIRSEIEDAMEKPDAVEETYRFLFQGGNWTQILLFHDRKYTDQCEKLMPKTCDMLKKALPQRDVHHMPWTSNQNEQVLVLKMDVGTDVETHCGPANNILNVHLGISGTEGAKLIVADKEYGWEEGKVIAWDGSYDHRVHCKDCKKDRIIMMVRYMHPDMTREHYRGNQKTHFEEIPKSWFPYDQDKFAKWAEEEKKAEEAAAAVEAAAESSGEDIIA